MNKCVSCIHATAYFILWWNAFVFYFADRSCWNSNLIWIQLANLKKKTFLFTIPAMGQNLRFFSKPAQSASSSILPCGPDLWPDQEPSGQHEPMPDSSSSWRLDREGSFLPQPKIHQIPTETWFKLRLEIASELYSCCVESGSKTPINRRAFMQNFCKNRAKP
jgi:hypothetical protein